MKAKFLFFLLIVVSFTLVLCQKNDINEKPPKLTYVETELGGCNSPSSVQNKSITLKNDTVVISNQNDSVSVFVGLNYICHAPFITEYEVKNDSNMLSIKDTCLNPYHSCYSRCMCYYTFDFKFIKSGKGNWHYKILLFDPRVPGSKVVQQGTINTF